MGKRVITEFQKGAGLVGVGRQEKNTALGLFGRGIIEIFHIMSVIS